MLVSTGRIGSIFGVEGNTVRVWRIRYDDFPEPETTVPYPMYDMGKIQRWYASRWPDRTGSHMRIHRYQVSPEGVRLTSKDSGNLDYAQGYIKAVRDLMFGDWRVFFTKDGFSAHKGNESEVWVVDPTDAEPEPWYVYDTRFKTGGKTK